MKKNTYIFMWGMMFGTVGISFLGVGSHNILLTLGCALIYCGIWGIKEKKFYQKHKLWEVD